MTFSRNGKSARLPILFSLLLALGLTACNHPERRRDRQLIAPQVHIALDGATDYFQGRLHATATLSSISRQDQGPREKTEMDARIRPHETGITSQGPEGRPRGGRGQGGQGGGYGRNNVGSQLPPVSLRIAFTNESDTAITFAIRDVNSVLGNFVAQPDLATLEPGQSVELEPMISRMGMTSANLKLDLELRADGQTETQTILLQEK